MVEGPSEIDPRHTKADYFPNFLDDYVDAKEVSRVLLSRVEAGN
jgi:hypothetical protein